MINLAGNKQCDIEIQKELKRARILDVHGEQNGREVDATVTGRLGRFTFTRAWRYWVVEGLVPIFVARVLYRDPVGVTDIRVAGHCGCPSPDEPLPHRNDPLWAEWFDDQGLRVFVRQEFNHDGPGSADEFLARYPLSAGKRLVETYEERERVARPYITVYHIDSEVGLRVFVDTLKQYNLV